MSKEQERAELHRTIWQIANDLRGSVDGSDFKRNQRAQYRLILYNNIFRIESNAHA